MNFSVTLIILYLYNRSIIENTVKIELDNLRETYDEETGEISAEDFRLAIISIMENSIDDREQVFTEEQREIIEIHRALTLRFMRHFRWGRM